MTGNWYMAWLEEGVYQILQRCAKYSMKNEEDKKIHSWMSLKIVFPIKYVKKYALSIENH